MTTYDAGASPDRKWVEVSDGGRSRVPERRKA